jgi:hypothetical protein
VEEKNNNNAIEPSIGASDSNMVEKDYIKPDLKPKFHKICTPISLIRSLWWKGELDCYCYSAAHRES